jgi:TetR/AcrR family transcriptional regulator, transcriptional repressor for nem operon
MVRRKSYDEAEVLSGAMHAFRRAGYAGLSISALEAATGLSSGSIYNSFGDKRGIFLASFEHYLRAVLGRRIAQFAQPESGLSGLRQLFLTLMREPEGETFGCLITNSAIEFGSGDDLAAAAIARGLDVLDRLFAERLSAAKSAGLLPDNFDVRSGAVRLLALYQGALVLVRGGFDLKKIRAAIRQEFDHLEGKAA